MSDKRVDRFLAKYLGENRIGLFAVSTAQDHHVFTVPTVVLHEDDFGDLFGHDTPIRVKDCKESGVEYWLTEDEPREEDEK